MELEILKCERSELSLLQNPVEIAVPPILNRIFVITLAVYDFQFRILLYFSCRRREYYRIVLAIRFLQANQRSCNGSCPAEHPNSPHLGSEAGPTRSS